MVPIYVSSPRWMRLGFRASIRVILRCALVSRQGSAWQAHRQLDSRGDDPRCPAGGEEYIYDSGGRNTRSTLCRDGNGNSNLPATVRKKSLSSQLQYAM